MNLFHTWGNVPVATNCNGDDEVDDTPPTTGHFGNGDPYGATASGSCNAASLYDQSCTKNTVSLAKILLDATSSPAVDSGNKGFDYLARTNLTLDSVRIYPSNIGEEFEITHYKQASGGGAFSVANVYNTKREKVGKTSTGGSTVVTSHTSTDRAGITFTAHKHLWIDSFKVYPSTIGDSIIINLTKLNGDTIKVFKGVTTTNTGAQNIPFSAFIPNATGYKLTVVRNPGLYSDSIAKSTLDSINSTANNQLKHYRIIDGAIEYTTFILTIRIKVLLQVHTKVVITTCTTGL